MKRMIDMNKNRLARVVNLFLVLGAAFFIAACTETIDESNYATADKKTVYGHIEEDPDFSDIKAIFDEVKLIGDGSTASSTVANTLQTRGNYTCFLPTNEAVRNYVRELKNGSDDISLLSYSEKQHIALSCIIDNGTTSAYESPDFPTSESSFLITNLEDRTLSCREVSTDESGNAVDPYYQINGEARVITADIEVSNGYIHTVDHVISPSTEDVPDLIGKAANLQIFSQLLELTGWDVKTQGNNTDATYEETEHSETEALNGVYDNFTVPQHRYMGYTILAETDEVLANWVGRSVVNGETISEEEMTQICNLIRDKAKEVYVYNEEGFPSETSDEDTNVNSPLNRFVAYHILNGKISNFVRHFNEYYYQYGDATNPQSTEYTVDVWDYYTTEGSPKGLIKVVQTPEDGYPIYVNRVAEYDNDTYQEVQTVQPGIKLNMSNPGYDNNGQNGYYYTLDGVLLYDREVRRDMANERFRHEMVTMLPEMLSNNLRGTDYYYLPTGFFDNISNESSDTRIFYLQCGRGNSALNWLDWQGDEFIFAGLFDFIIQLPPVPISGNYEIRMGSSMNPQRGMAQIYVGDDPQNLVPAGLPFDARQSLVDNPAIPWVEDEDDEEINKENDRNLRNLGYMKGPKYMMQCDGKGRLGSSVRDVRSSQMGHVRRIITTNYPMQPGKTYYLRFKSALEKRDAQWFMDYIEIVNSSVYNGAEVEDIW